MGIKDGINILVSFGLVMIINHHVHLEIWEEFIVGFYFGWLGSK